MGICSVSHIRLRFNPRARGRTPALFWDQHLTDPTTAPAAPTDLAHIEAATSAPLPEQATQPPQPAPVPEAGAAETPMPEAPAAEPHEAAPETAPEPETATDAGEASAEEPPPALPAEEPPRTLFADLGLSEPVLRAVEEMGYRHPTPIQEQAIPYVLMGRDVLGTGQTGNGKT